MDTQLVARPRMTKGATRSAMHLHSQSSSVFYLRGWRQFLLTLLTLAVRIHCTWAGRGSSTH
eukprot:10475959-Karenia_brevis.AAC.1